MLRRHAVCTLRATAQLPRAAAAEEEPARDQREEGVSETAVEPAADAVCR